jgi:sugar phosphate isomerase/epimerase
MDVGISTRCFGTAPLTLDLLERLRRAEFTQIELHASLPAFNYANRSVARDITRWFRENELPPPSLHLPFEKNVVGNDRFERQAALDELKRCLELSDLVQLRFVVLHLGEPHQDFNPAAFEYAYAAVATVQSFSGARVLLETLPNEIATFQRIEEFKAAAQLGDVGICYDTGHGEMDGMSGANASPIGRSHPVMFDAIHLNDNNGDEDDDSHLWPFDGARNWPALVERLTLQSFNGPLILEAGDDKLNRASDSRSRLRDLMGEAANSIEEFRLKYKLPVSRAEDER